MLSKMFPKNGEDKPELRFSGFTDAWELRKLGEAGQMYQPQTVTGSDLIESGIPVFGANGYIGFYTDYNHKEDQVTISARGEGTGTPSYVKGPVWITGNSMVVNVNESGVDKHYLYANLSSRSIKKFVTGGAQPQLTRDVLVKVPISIPKHDEQKQIGTFFQSLDNLITLHQRTQKIEKGKKMFNNINKEDTFSTYFAQWITVYKKGAIRDVTLSKYQMTHTWIEKIAPSLRLSEINRMSYQQLLNEYALYHERQTTMDFHHHLKGAILDAVDEGLIDRDPTRKAIIKGKNPREKKPKFLNQYELHTLIKNLKLGDKINWDWLILLVAKTGMRFSEALALTPSDFDFAQQSISISKTWDYKKHGGFLPTKNKSSVRKLQVDWQTTSQFSNLLKNYPKDEPIFVAGRVFNSTVNTILYRHCKQLNIPTITIHGLRHTHASLLLFAGVSIASVARRLGHSSITTTQKTYLHIIHELENQDTDLVIRSLSRLV